MSGTGLLAIRNHSRFRLQSSSASRADTEANTVFLLASRTPRNNSPELSLKLITVSFWLSPFALWCLSVTHPVLCSREMKELRLHNSPKRAEFEGSHEFLTYASRRPPDQGWASDSLACSRHRHLSRSRSVLGGEQLGVTLDRQSF